MNLRTYYNTIFFVHWLCKIEIENSKAPTCCLVSIQQFVKRMFLGGKAEYIEASLRVAPCAKQWLFQPREPDGGPALCVTDYVMSVIGVIFQFAVTGRLLPVRPQLPPLDRRRYQLWTPTTTTTRPDMNTQTRFSAHQQPFSTLAIDLSRPWPGSSVTISHQSTSLPRERPTDPRLSRPLCRVYSDAEA